MTTINAENLNTKDPKKFTVAELARAMEIPEKRARNRYRANLAADSGDRLKTPHVAKTDVKNTKYVFALTDANIAAVSAIIANPS